MCVSSASKSKPLGSTLDSAGAAEDKDKEKTVPSAAKTQDNTPTTPTKTDREKKDKPSKKKEKSSKGASANLPPVESKPPPGPLVALGRRDKPLKRPRSVEKGPQSLSCPHTLYSLCGVCVCVCVFQQCIKCCIPPSDLRTLCVCVCISLFIEAGPPTQTICTDVNVLRLMQELTADL